MGKKSGQFFFDKFSQAASISCEAAQAVYTFLKDYDPDQVEKRVAELHEIEHRGDEIKHEIMNELVRAFITPIEREDIIDLAQSIDNVTDAIEDIIIHYMFLGTADVRPESVQFSELLVRCCQTMQQLVTELQNFKKSKKLAQLVVELNNLEEQGDAIYIDAMTNLHRTEKDAVVVIALRDVFNYLERACDACEHVGDIVESVAIGNM
ncbi:MAG: DUF47 domain-containing protein [Clostridiales bacterium]|uniref:DUF47 domain-containing protein n=1 Tax=Candidatus Scybalenecus merdavium TaxID=2840939 RepID=A0A9D1MSQ0_9FIRM|nr:DUF47 domain-containing protein [Clostridiales bacterium]HIU68333.1 DUF47 domain-containing protein [Candidatus Scubalenecus merdavium]